jgi:hypothetical protein
MFISKQRLLTISMASLFLCSSSVGYAYDASHTAKLFDGSENDINKTSLYIGLLYIKPYSNNLKYATFVSGTQPYFQSWHYQEIKPNYHTTFELGFNYAIAHTPYSATVDWTHLDSNDSSSKQATTNTDIATVEFVGPPYEMSPPVFGIKHVDSSVNFNFDNVLLNGSKLVELDSHFLARFFGGIDLLKLNQTIATTFSDYAGTPPTPYSYSL